MEKEALLEFYKVEQVSQVLGSENESATAKIFFRVTIDGKTEEKVAIVNQPHGSSFSYDEDPIEISNPFIGIPFNYGAFRDEAEKYYKLNIGANAVGIFVESGANDIVFSNNNFGITHKVILPLPPEPSPAW